MIRLKNIVPALVLLLAACGGGAPDTEEIRQAVAARFERPLCMILSPRMPIYAPASAEAQYMPLVDAGILEKTTNPKLNNTVIFRATAAGESQFNRRGEICYGQLRVLRVESVSRPAAHNGGTVFTVARVVFLYDITAEWARAPIFNIRVQKGEVEKNIVLIKTDKGWQTARRQSL